MRHQQRWAHMPSPHHIWSWKCWNVMWSVTARGVHCYTAHQALSEAHHYSVHRVLEGVSNNTWPPASMQWGLHAEYGDVHSQHLENERWTKNSVSCANIVLFFNLTSAEMVAGLNSMCVVHSWQGERPYCKYKVSIRLFRCQVTLSGVRYTSLEMCLFTMKQEVVNCYAIPVMYCPSSVVLTFVFANTSKLISKADVHQG